MAREKVLAGEPKRREVDDATAPRPAEGSRGVLPGKQTLLDTELAPPLRQQIPGRRTLTEALEPTTGHELAGGAPWRTAERRSATVYRRAIETDTAIDDPAIDEALGQLGAGTALPETVRHAMEVQFRVPLDRVRVHTDRVAADAARAMHAAAFTVGEDIFFAEGEFAPEASGGMHLLAHELAHVVQGWEGRTATGAGLRVSEPGEHLEREAESVAERVVRGEHAVAAAAPAAHAPQAAPRSQLLRAPKPVEDKVGGAHLDPVDRRRVMFPRPVTLQRALRHVFNGTPPATVLRPVAETQSAHDRFTCFELHFASIDEVMQLRDPIRTAYINAGVIGAKVPPIEEQIPAWVPPAAREQILALAHGDAQVTGVRRLPGVPPWGELIVWIGKVPGSPRAIEVFMEYPSDPAFYLARAKGDERTARLLLHAHTEFNRDLRYFLDKGMSISQAREQLRAINNEVFKLVIMAAVTMLEGGAALGALRRPPLEPQAGRRVPRTVPDDAAVTATPAPRPSTDPLKRMLADPAPQLGRTAEEIAAEFEAAGYKTQIRASTKGSKKATIVTVEGHPEVSQVQVHPGGGRHEGAYVKVSTSTQGIIKIVDGATYKATPGEKAQIIRVSSTKGSTP